MAGTNKATATVSTTGSTSECVALRNTPLERLKRATTGDIRVQLEDLQAVLAAHAVQADCQARTLATRGEELLEMLFEPAREPKKGKKREKLADPAAVLDVMARLTKMYGAYAGEARKSIELLDRLSRPRSPSLKVVAAGKQINVAGAQQVNTVGSRDGFRR